MSGLNAAAKVETTEMTAELTGEVWEELTPADRALS